jgi:hypothetical protein
MTQMNASLFWMVGQLCAFLGAIAYLFAGHYLEAVGFWIPLELILDRIRHDVG